MATLRWSSRAARDLRRIRGYISMDDSAAAQRWVDDVLVRLRHLSHMPRSARIVPELELPHVREAIVGPYRLVYAINGDDMVMLTLFHSRRRFPIEAVVGH